MYERKDGRGADALREIRMLPGFVRTAAGSCLVECGGTRVICTASVQEGVPSFLKGKGQGWLTAEYAMLPRANSIRKGRQATLDDKRSAEISRLIGRSLRSVVDMEVLGKHTITIDCDVIQADGGTRCASITGAFIALSLAVRQLLEQGRIHENPISDNVVAVSAGILNGEMIVDLDFEEDRFAEMDANFVMSGGGKIIEIQATGEKHPFDVQQLNTMIEMVGDACAKLVDLQNQVLE